MATNGSDGYFAREIGLPSAGLDPGRDCNHVSDEFLFHIFGAKEWHKGYNYRNSKSLRVRERCRELYLPIWQTTQMPKLSFVPESFARGVVSEVCFNFPMNWARYAEDRWNGQRPEPGQTPPILYEGPSRGNGYFEMIVKRYEGDLQASVVEHEAAVLAHGRAKELHNTLVASQRRPLTGSERDKASAELIRLKEVLESSNKQLEELKRELKSLIDEHGNSAVVTWHEEEIRNEEAGITAVKQLICRKEERLVVSGVDIAQHAEEEKKLEAEESATKLKADRLGRALKWLQENCPSPMISAPSSFAEGDARMQTSAEEIGVIKIGECALCGSGFPHLNIIVAPCSCGYHPWCAAVHCLLQDKCADPTCNKHILEAWRKSSGFFQIEGILQLLDIHSCRGLFNSLHGHGAK